MTTDINTIISEIEVKFEVYDKIVIFYLIGFPDLGIFNGNNIFPKANFRKISTFIRTIDFQDEVVRDKVGYFETRSKYIAFSEQFERDI